MDEPSRIILPTARPRLTLTAADLAHCFYFLGIDTAPSATKRADDGAAVVLRVRPRPGIDRISNQISDWLQEYVYARTVRAQGIREWSGYVHQLHRAFGFAGIMMDPHGGGQWLEIELMKQKQLLDGVETRVIPIASVENAEREPNAQFILNMFRRSDPMIAHMWGSMAGDDNLYHAMHVAFQEAVEHKMPSFPKPIEEWTDDEKVGWTVEHEWVIKNLDALRRQLISIQVATMEDGTYATTKHGALTFSAGGRKDIAYAGIYAHTRFRSWLANGEIEDEAGGGGDDSFIVMT